MEYEIQLLEVDRSGFLTKKSIKTHKVTNPKKRWCVLRGNFLYYYTSQSVSLLIINLNQILIVNIFITLKQTHASGMIPVEYYDMEQQRSKQKFELTLKHKEESFITGAPTYVFECENEEEHLKWANAIIRKVTGIYHNNY